MCLLDTGHFSASIGLIGEQHFGRYIGVAFIEGLFGTWVPGRYTEVAFIQGWPLRGVPLFNYSTAFSTCVCRYHSNPV